MKKYAAFAASVAISAATLVGCGGDDDFCSDAEGIVGSESMPSGDEMQELADAAPDEISDDFQVIADGSDDPTSADPEAMQEAANNIQSWGQENCE